MQNPRAPENRQQGAARHLVRQAARAADRPLLDQRHAARHVSTELGRDRRAGLRRGRARAARHRRRRSAGASSTRLKPDERSAPRGPRPARRTARSRRWSSTEADLTVGEAVLDAGARRSCSRGRRARRPKTACATRCTWRPSSCTSSCTGNNAAAIYDPRHRSALHERPRDLRDLLALPVSHRVPRRQS